MSDHAPNIVCFGEVLWDVLPSGKRVGGAPLNVAFHFAQLHGSTSLVSSIGKDALGAELIQWFAQHNLDTSLLQTSTALPTGTVQVNVDAKGSPSYDIVTPVAWDDIRLNVANQQAVRQADALVFGSLAARNITTHDTLLALLSLAPLAVFDVNLRSPHYSKALLLELLPLADIVKMNDEELAIIGSWLDLPGPADLQALQLKDHFSWKQLLVTRGPQGAWLFNESGLHTATGVPVLVKDTVGSGDAFLAAYLSTYLRQQTPEECLTFASAAGAYVATQQGGTPSLSEESLWSVLDR